MNGSASAGLSLALDLETSEAPAANALAVPAQVERIPDAQAEARVCAMLHRYPGPLARTIAVLQERAVGGSS